MKLNEKGKEVYSAWEKKYYAELERIRKELNDPEWSEGWCIIDNDDFEHDINDIVGVMIFGDDVSAIYNILEHFRPSDHYAYGYTATQVVEMMKQYFDISADEDLTFKRKDG